ncbi:MAG: ABC transporter substrate-binding protein [Alphaproteobacteria bacterium]
MRFKIGTSLFMAACLMVAAPAVDAKPPEEALTVEVETPGKPGGTLRLLMGREKDTRMVTVYGYARLLRFTPDYELEPDILRAVEVHEGSKVFRFHLRKGHKWSDGHPFTAEDFRYYWEDVALNKTVSPYGPPKELCNDDKTPAEFAVIDDYTVEYRFKQPNPGLLPRLAEASPLYLYRPAHYLKQFHADYQDAETLAGLVEQHSKRNWASLHNGMARQYKTTNPHLPVLQPWVLNTKPPAQRFTFRRNPHFHRVDQTGTQLPYIDQIVMTIAERRLIPARLATGEADIHGRYISFEDYTFLKRGEDRGGYNLRLWQPGKGSRLALYPNMNTVDPAWGPLIRDVRFRRALSLGIHRREINQVLYFGLAREAGDTVLPASPLFRDELANAWTQYDPDKANHLLDEIGLTARNDRGLRLLPNGEPMELIIATAGVSTEQSDVLELVKDHWLKLGIRAVTRPTQRDVFRSRIQSGETVMSIFEGFEGGLAMASLSPASLAPSDPESQYQWPLWARYQQTMGQAGEKPSLDSAKQLIDLNHAWKMSRSKGERHDIWSEMLDICADNVFTIGLVTDVPMPILVNKDLRGVPDMARFNWNPGAFFGIHRMETWWLDRDDVADAR